MNARIQALVAAATTAELVAFYNARAIRPVTKFSDRKTAEARVLREIEGLVSQGLFCPHCGEIKPERIGASDIAAAGPEGANRHRCHRCGTEYHPDGREHKACASNATRSAAIAASWSDEAVRAARATRHGVQVKNDTGLIGQYKSVREAFERLGLPLSKHIRFRKALKAAGALAFGDLMFRVQQ